MTPDDYISSFSFDWRLAPYDIEGSIAHVRMLSRRKIIPSSDAAKIIRGLEGIGRDLERGRKIPRAEDVHFAIENELVRRIGEVGKKMHTARSRNDQVALDLKLYVRDITGHILEQVKAAQAAILACAEKNADALMPGFTHLQHGQPIFFAHHILAYGWMMERDRGRLKDMLSRLDESPLGACALAGTSLPIDRKQTARALGFSRPTENSLDTVSDRDFIAEFLFASALLMAHLSRLAEDLIIWASAEFEFAQIAPRYTSGSSIMPQKRNPDTLELLRGKSARTISNLNQLLVLLKGLPLSYNRDLQEDKPPLFDSAENTLLSLNLVRGVVESLKINRRKMEKSCDKGFLLATELADYLARKGLPFRKAHAIVSKIVDEVSGNQENLGGLESLQLSTLQSYSPLFQSDVYRFLSPRSAAESRNSYGGTGNLALKRQMKQLRSLLKK